MKNLYGWILGVTALVLFSLSACNDETEISPDKTQTNITENPAACILIAEDFHWENNRSRSSLTIDGGYAKFSWTPGDRVGILPDTGAQVYFEIPQSVEGNEPTTDEERRKATFDGGAWALKGKSNYAAYYPFIKDFDLDRTKIPVDYTGQKQTGITTTHLGAYDYLGARPKTTNETGGVSFAFDHVGALVLLRFTVTEARTQLKSVTMAADNVLFTTKGTYDLTTDGTFIVTPTETSGSFTVEIDYTTQNENEEITAYFMCAPIDLSGKKVNVSVAYGEGADVLNLEVDGKNLVAGYGHLLEAEEPLDIEVVYNPSKAVAALTIEENDEDIAKAVEKAFTNESIQYLLVENTLTDSQQTALCTALKGKIITLCLPKILEEDLVDALNNETDNITVYCPFSDASKAKKGDVALLDGTFFTNDYLWIVKDYLDAAGVVFWTEGETEYGTSTLIGNNVADKVMQIDYPNCTHGLIVSLKDVSTSLLWQSWTESVYVNFQLTDKFAPTNTEKSKYMSIRSSLSSTDYISKILGYNNTKVIEAYNTYREDHKYDYIVNPVAKLAEFTETNSAPMNTTGWFLPSVKELFILYYMDVSDIIREPGTLNAYTKDEVNETLNYIDGDKLDGIYWSSTEDDSNAGFAYTVNMGYGHITNNGKNAAAYRVRAVCAF